MEEPRLDEFFREKVEGFSPPAYDPTAWAKLEPRMNATTASPILWYWISGALGALLLFSWLYFLSGPSGERQIVQQLDSLQLQINRLTESQLQIQKDTVYVYLSNDSINQLISNAYKPNTFSPPLTHTQNLSIGRSANSRTKTSFDPQSGLNSPLVPSEKTLENNSLPSDPISTQLQSGEQKETVAIDQSQDLMIDRPSATDSTVGGIPSENDFSVKQDAVKPQNQPDSTAQAEALMIPKSDSTALLTISNPSDSSLSVRPQPQREAKPERSLIFQNWLMAREIRTGLQISSGSLWSPKIGAGLQTSGGLSLSSNLNDQWWIQTGLDFAYRTYEAENEDEELPQELRDALPGLVDPITPTDLKEYYMNGVSLGVPLALRREFYLNRNWDMGIQASIIAHRYLQQKFDYQSITDEEITYQSRGTEQQWTLSPIRLSILAIHNDRFRPSIGLYTEYDMMTRGVEPIRFWSVGMQASFGLQLK